MIRRHFRGKKRSPKVYASFSNDIGTSLIANPYFMHAAGVYVDTVADAISNLVGVLVLGISDGKVPTQDQMGCQTTMRMRGVVRVPEL